jgi:DHA1 family tetracycline resistance protein-like MFS transporter
MIRNRASVGFIFVTILLDALGIGLLIPVFPDIIRRFGHDPSFVSHTFGYFISVYAAMQFVASPILGSLSDRFGRRSILLISLLCAGCDYILMAFAPNLGFLFAGRILAGLTGASMTVASSYMADISTDKNRSSNFGMIGAAFGLGFIFGPGIGGLLSKYGPQAPFIGAAVLNLCNFAFGLLVLPESLPLDSRRQIELSKLNPLASLLRTFRLPNVGLLLWIYGLIFLAGQAHPSIWTLYTQHKFGWTSTQVGVSLSFVGLSIAIAQGYLTRIIIPRIGETKSLTLGLIIYIVGFGAFAFATKGWMMYAIMVIFALSGVAGPALQSLISRGIPPSQQGELQGSLISITSLTAIIGPLAYTWFFSRFTDPHAPFQFPGVAYFAASIICFVGLISALWYKEHQQGIL